MGECALLSANHHGKQHASLVLMQSAFFQLFVESTQCFQSHRFQIVTCTPTPRETTGSGDEPGTKHLHRRENVRAGAGASSSTVGRCKPDPSLKAPPWFQQKFTT